MVKVTVAMEKRLTKYATDLLGCGWVNANRQTGEVTIGDSEDNNVATQVRRYKASAFKTADDMETRITRDMIYNWNVPQN